MKKVRTVQSFGGLPRYVCPTCFVSHRTAFGAVQCHAEAGDMIQVNTTTVRVGANIRELPE